MDEDAGWTMEKTVTLIFVVASLVILFIIFMASLILPRLQD
jgi:hypothetical protein